METAAETFSAAMTNFCGFQAAVYPAPGQAIPQQSQSNLYLKARTLPEFSESKHEPVQDALLLMIGSVTFDVALVDCILRHHQSLNSYKIFIMAYKPRI